MIIALPSYSPDIRVLRFCLSASITAVLLLSVFQLRAAEPDSEFRPLFNGQDLAGWVSVNVAPDTFTVRDNMIVSTGKPTGIIHTEKQYENFIMEIEWRHMHAKGNAGIFIWSEPMTAPGTPFAKSIEVQVLDPAAGNPEGLATGHGDVFAIHGAHLAPDRPHPRGWERCLPSEHRAHPAGEWNHYRIEARDGRIQLAVNGKVVSGASQCTPRKGYICLESEGSECHFRNLKIRELPSTDPAPHEIASQALNWKTLYTGIDLDGWRTEKQAPGNWEVKDWILEANPNETARIWTEARYGNCLLQLDWRPRSTDTRIHILAGDDQTERVALATDTEPLGRTGWNRTSILFQSDSVRVFHNQRVPAPMDLLRSGTATEAAFPLGIEVTGGSAQFASIFVLQAP